MNLKDVTPESLTAAIVAATEQAQRSIDSAAESATTRLAESVRDARAAASLVAEIADIDAATLLARSAVAVVRELVLTEQYDNGPFQLRGGRLELYGTGALHNLMLDLRQDNGPSSLAVLNPGRYRCIFLMVPVEE